MRLRYSGTCARCGVALPRGANALYDPVACSVRCVECVLPDVDGEPAAFDGGVAGASALREFERRTAARQARVKGVFGSFLGGVALAITDEPQSIRAWKRGSFGEQQLADALRDVADLRALHDRRVPQTRANIDHLLISPAGVFVVDAKLYKGQIHVRDKGGFLSSDERLYVGTRDCSHFAADMTWQVQAVRRALEAGDFDRMPAVVPVLCFINGEWPLLWRPRSYRGVRIEGNRSIKKLISGTPVLGVEAVHNIAQLLAVKFPAK